MNKLETATQNPGGGEKKVGYSSLWALKKGCRHPFGKEAPPVQQAPHPRDPLLGVFCPVHRAQGTQGQASPRTTFPEVLVRAKCL